MDTKIPWPKRPEPEPEEPDYGDAARHTDRRGRRSTRFPDVNISATAEQVGVTKAHLAKILAGTVRPSMDVAVRLARVLGQDLNWVAALYRGKRARS